MSGETGSRSLLRPPPLSGDDSSRPAIRLAVVSRIRLYREGLAESLGAGRSVEVVASAIAVETDLARIAGARPDVVLLDASPHRAHAAVRMLAAAVPGVRVVALAVDETETDVIPLAEAGVAGYLTIDQSLAELRETILGVAHGDAPCSPALAGMLLRRVRALADGSGRDAQSALTRREHDILALIRDGLSNKEIARELQIALPTVKNHVHNVLEKLGVATRAATAALPRT